MKTLLLLCLSVITLFAESSIKYTPISHASFIIETTQEVIYVDPTGSEEEYSKLPKPSLILITDVHGDHLNPELIEKLKGRANVVGPAAAMKKVEGKTVNNGDTLKIGEVHIRAVPMYNTTEERSHFHEKGRGNGYVLRVDKRQIYISGDTEDIPEMRALKDIDDAFLCMNLPYTMTVDQAISAVEEFQPKRVYPYHYRGKKDGKTVFSDVERFKLEVEKSGNTEVVLLKWY